TPPNDTYEIYDPAVGFNPPAPAPIVMETDPYCLFPFTFVLPNGKLFVHANTSTRFLDLTHWSWDATLLTTVSGTARTYPSTGTAVLLPLLPGTSGASPAYNARVLLIGGAGVSCPSPGNADSPATGTCEILDVGSGGGWQPAATMPHARVMPDAVLLPDGTVLVTNGSSTGVADNGINPVLEADLYDPATDTWTTMAAMRVPRLYHSTALLLPDGRVLTAGKDEEFNPYPFNYPEYRIEVFSPPYLFKGPRPTITAAPGAIGYGATFEVETPDGGTVAAACLMAPGAATHSFNMGQRHVGLTVAAAAGGSVWLVAPPDANVAPPGYYMLFLLSAAGVPSVGKFVQLG
ncbi:MAG TPA: galactose oxidase-like domain-containing protein, partial [Chloroflexota bacterium]|nr:galactose oxidase-like domain-containing protein [Chloroflexota bacterium]